MKFSRFVALVTMVSISSGAYLLHAQTKSHAKKKKTPAASAAAPAPVIKAPVITTGKDAFIDYTQEKPGVYRKITVPDLPEPFATESVDNGPKVVPRPSGAWPQALPGFKVELYASELDNPRLIRTAPNGDIFLAESKPHNMPGNVQVFRGLTADGRAEKTEVFATGLKQPFAIPFYPPAPDPQCLSIATTNSLSPSPSHNN